MLKDIFEVSATAAVEKYLRTYRDCISDGQPNGASTFEREDIADMRIHEVCVCVCTRMYTCTCAHLRTHPFPRLMKKMPLFESLELEMT